MTQPSGQPFPSQLAKAPVTAAVMALAVIVTVAWFGHWNIGVITEDVYHLPSQPWRFVTSVFPHVNVFHLVFNLYWIWMFGQQLERAFGHVVYAVIFLLLAVGSSAAAWAFMDGGVGLSGVGYGFFGMMWVLVYRDPRFARSMNSQTVMVFVVWFFICILLTNLKIMQVANVAHGAGGVMGSLIAWALVWRGGKRAAMWTGIVLATAGIAVAAIVYRPYLTFSPTAGEEYFDAAFDALKDGKPDLAATYSADAVRFPGAPPEAWYNYGVAMQRKGDYVRALEYFKDAAARKPEDAEMQQAVRDEELMLKYRAGQAGAVGTSSGPSTR